jgi:hypothetical protein
MIGTLIAGMAVIAGCNPDVGTAPPTDRKALSEIITKQEEKDANTRAGVGGAPKLIKGKVLKQPAGPGN